ncbi:MAG: hypothetical protein AB7J35_10280 [Dehalococcoidia bacterium]
MNVRVRRNLFPRILFVQVLVVFALVLGVVDSFASGGTTIGAGSATIQENGQGETTTVITRAVDDAHLNAFDISLSFDPSVVSVASVAPAAGWSFMPAPMIDNVAGSVRVVAVRFDQCGTTCPAFAVTWNGLAAGVSPLALNGDPNQSLAGTGQYIASGFTGGSITVTAPPTPAATPSPTSTASPTASPASSPTASPTATATAPATPAPGAPAAILAGSGGAATGAAFTTTAALSLPADSPRPDSFDLTLIFDPSVATVDSITPGPGWSFAPQPGFDNAGGKLHVSALRFSDCSAYCPLFIVNWTAAAPGSALLQIDGAPANVLGKAGAPLDATFTPGSVSVADVAGPQAPKPSQPAATPSATATPAPNADDVPVLPFTPGWNLLTWGGEPMSPEKALSSSNPTAIEMIYVWNPETGRWQRYGPNLPAYLNDLKTINSGDVMWLSATSR